MIHSEKLEIFFSKKNDQDTMTSSAPTQVIDRQLDLICVPPYIAYKHAEQDNHKICIVNDSQDVPQKFVDLGEWHFVQFVGYDQINFKEKLRSEERFHLEVRS